MRKLLLAINALLVLLILWLALYWNPEPAPAPLPGTHAARMTADAR